MSVDVLTVSSKGQIALPIEMRRRLSIKQGDKFVAFDNGDVIVLKPIKLPTEDEFMLWLNEASAWAKNVNLQESQVSDIISEYRAEKRAKEE